MMKENIVVTVLYAIVVSILGSNVAAISLRANGDAILLAIAAFFFCTGYFFDDLRQRTSTSICPWVVSAWACFIIQATTIQRPVWSAFFGAIGLLLITIGMLAAGCKLPRWVKKNEKFRESGKRKCWWKLQNIGALVLLVGYILICKVPCLKLIVKNTFETIKAWPFHRQFLLLVAILSFVMLCLKLFHEKEN